MKLYLFFILTSKWFIKFFFDHLFISYVVQVFLSQSGLCSKYCYRCTECTDLAKAEKIDCYSEMKNKITGLKEGTKFACEVKIKNLKSKLH